MYNYKEEIFKNTDEGERKLVNSTPTYLKKKKPAL